MRGLVSIVILTLALAAVPAKAVTVTLDTATSYQTIDGFGFFGPKVVWWGSSSTSAFYDDAWLTMILDNLGITIWRNEYYSEEASQDANWAKQRPMVTALKAKADALGVPLKFIFSVWTPPSRFKDNASLKNGGHLLAANYAAFGTWLAQGVRNYANAGISLYALSAQNEPLFEEPYNSCVYTIAEYVAMMKVAGPIVHDSFPNVQMFGPEHMLFGAGKDWDWDNLDPSKAVLGDAAANAQLGTWACHGYGADGRTPTASSEEAQFWIKARQHVGPFNKPMWMTETSGYGNDWASSMDYVQSVHAALFYGRVNGWVHWYGADDLVTATALTKKGYAVKHYYRYVRPGAKAVSATVQSDAELFVTAYKHATNRSVTIVMINSGAAAKPITFAGSALPAQFQMYQSSATDNCADKGLVANTAVTLPANSITTLFHADPISVAPPRSNGRHGMAPAGRLDGSAKVLHRLDGAAVSSRVAKTGVYVSGREGTRPSAVSIVMGR